MSFVQFKIFYGDNFERCKMHRMKKERFQVHVITYREFTCEVFDPCVNQWSLVASPAVPRAACAIASVDETVYLFGGENEERLLDDVEMLDVKSNEWHQISCTLPKPLSYAQASLLKLPKKLLKHI